MKERPIIFSGSMVRAILEDRKTQTRRIVKLPVNAKDVAYWETPSRRPEKGYASPGINYWTERGNNIDPCPYGFPGDRLWVRETWRRFDAIGECGHADFPCSCPPHGSPLYRASHDDGESKWTPSIHMPRAVSRLFLDVKAIRVERLQDISIEDAISEGINCPVELDEPCKKCGACEGDDWDSSIRFQCNPRSAFAELWQSINGKRPGCAWDDNPWVWVVEFKRVEE